MVAVILATSYKFLVQKNYEFIIEADCDPATETCFYRDCSTGECPPNELENYRVFLVSAADFPKCSDNSCLTEIENGTITAEEVVCDAESGNDCAVYEPEESEVYDVVEIEDGVGEEDLETADDLSIE